MFEQDVKRLQKAWLGWIETEIDELTAIGTELAQALTENRTVAAFGIGNDHWFAEELTDRLGGHPEIIGLFPEELMIYNRRMPAILECGDYAQVLIRSWKLKRRDVVLSFCSERSPLYSAMEKQCRRQGIQWLGLKLKDIDPQLDLFHQDQPYLPVYQVYAAQAVNAASFAVMAGLDPAAEIHRFNKIVLQILEQFEQTQLRNFAKLMEELDRKQGKLFVLGSGHSHMIQDYMAAYPLENVVPILESELMVFDPGKSGWTQTQPDYAQMIISKYKIQEQDVFLLPSNSGKSVMNVELARLLWTNRTTVATITNMKQSPVIRSDHPSGRRLFETSDIVIDNCCVNKDTCLVIDGERRCPVSSMILLLSGIILIHELSGSEEDQKDPPASFPLPSLAAE